MDSAGDAFGAPVGLDSDMPTAWDPNDLSMFDDTLSTDPIFDTRLFPNAFGTSPAVNTPAFAYSSPATQAPPSNGQNNMSQPKTSLQPRPSTSSTSPESSSQDSSSESSSRRKRKTSSESPPSAVLNAEKYDQGNWMKRENPPLNAQTSYATQDSMYGFNAAADVLSLGHDVDRFNIDAVNMSMANHFDFDSAGTSPGIFGTTAYDPTVTMPKVIPKSSGGQPRPLVSTTVRPSTNFFLGSREASPMSAAITASHEASPSAMFNDPPSFRTGDMFNNMTTWDGLSQQPTWQSDLSSNSLSGLTPSPILNTSASPLNTYQSVLGQQPAHIYIEPFQSKSRVETQTNVKLTLYPMPSGVMKLHLPTHTISKPKLLAKEVVKAPDTLELHAMLVCSSAMDNEQQKQRALRRAAGWELPVDQKPARRSSTGGMQNDDDPDDPNKPLNGGEVRICANCKNRERKRASRKRVKKQEDEESWYQYEDDRVIVLNTSEYKEWQPPSASKDGTKEATTDTMSYPDGAMQVVIPMRIACYCRHQGEKTGFRVIFTIKDHEGRLIAQEMTQSILITDDHKTHGPPTGGPGLTLVDGQQYPIGGGYFTAESQDIQPAFYQRPYHSTNDLQALRRNFSPQTFSSNPLSQPSGIMSQSSSASRTPRNLSRQASPTAQTGPNKKRKGPSVHHKIPSGLTMTRVDAAQPLTTAGIQSGPPNGLPSATSPFSPTRGFFMPTNDSNPLITPATMQSQYSTGPPTPNSASGLITPGHRNESMDNMAFQFYSAPNSAHPSRAASPVSTSRLPPMSAYQQQPPLMNGLPNSMTNVPFAAQTQQQQQQQQRQQQPSLLKILPPEGPKSGGIDVTCLGEGFHRDLEVMFGDNTAITTFWSANCLVCMLPPAVQAGTVAVTFKPSRQSGYSPPAITKSTTFRYIDDDEQQILELALRFMCHKATGSDDYRNYARDLVASAAVSNNWLSQGGGPPHPGMQQMQLSNIKAAMLGVMDAEEVLLKCLDKCDMDESPYVPRFNIKRKSGATMLSLSCSLGYNRFVAGLLARGANPDSRDKGGFTPLMMAAMHGHSQIVRRLILKGADPTMRTLQGYTAADLAATREVFNALQGIHSHVRSPSVGTPTLRSRADISAALPSLWRPPSPSQDSAFSFGSDKFELESEPFNGEDESIAQDGWAESRRNSKTWAASRRGSATTAAQKVHALAAPPPQGQAGFPSPAAAMVVWRDQLATQIHQFQQNVHWNFPNFQLPALPPMPNLPDYQAYPVVRRISSLVPQRGPSRNASGATATPATVATTAGGGDYSWRDLFTTPALPPSYEEIYPENADKDMDIKKTSTLQAAADTVLDQKCAEAFDTPTQTGSSSSSTKPTESKQNLNVRIGKKSFTKEQQEQLLIAHAQRLKKIQSDRNLFFIWLPLLFMIIVAMLKNRVPEILAAAAALSSFLRDGPAQQAVLAV